jgi:ATP-binding cassette subfamily B protein/ATP-binding cassette subfamily C protein LapB
MNSLAIAFKKVLDFYFGDISYETITNLSNSGLESFDTDDALYIAKELSIAAGSQKLDIDAVPNYLTPAILIANDEQAYFVQQKSNDGCILYNHETEKNESYSTKEIKKNFKEIILFFRNPTEKNEFHEKSREKKQWFWKPIKASWRAYLEVAILTVFINIFILAIPLFSKNIYDRVIPNFAKETLIILTFGIIMVLIFDIIFKSARIYIIEKVGKSVGSRYEELLMSKMLSVQSNQDSIPLGTKANLFTQLNSIKEFITSKTLIHILDFPFFILSIFVVYLISPTIAMVPIIAAGVIIIVNFFMQFPIATLSKEAHKHIGSKQAYLVETIEGGESIKLTNTTTPRIFEWRQVVNIMNAIAQKMHILNNFAANFSLTVVQSITIFVIFIGVYEINAKELSVGGLIAVTILSSRAIIPIVNISGVLLRLKEIKESLDAIDSFINLPSENVKHLSVGLEKIQGDIEFEQVNLSYKNTLVPTLKNITFSIKAGERVGIIGPTGAGKSTVSRLISGLEQPTSGNIYIDSHEISTIHPTEIRQNVGVMAQEPFIFAGTLKENIELLRPLGKEKLVELIKLSGLESMVKSSGQGENLMISEKGANISTGQKQLIALARALVNDPSILILDEPTAGLDIGLEGRVVRQLATIIENKTLIVITHRSAPLALVERLIVVDGGEIIADGKKEDVVKFLQTREHANGQ